jgi:DNA invertase Pin-like site-specific DNA recombinase
MATVYSYVRFSSKKQELGDSVRRQTKAGDEWLARHPEHTLDTSLRLHDLGVSAFRGANLEEKGALGAFIALAKKPDGPIAPGSILLIERLDRFSRQQTRKAYRAFVELVEAGVTIQTLEPLQTISESNVDDLHVVLPLVLQMCMAHEQSKEKSSRVGAVWHAKRERARVGEPMFRRGPSWLKWDDDAGAFKPIPAAVAAIQYIFQRTIDGAGQRNLVTELNKLHKPIGHSRTWNSSYVQKVLNDRAVLGELQPHRFDESGNRVADGEPIPDYYPRIIPDNIFYAAGASKERRTRAKGRNTKFVNLFVGSIFGDDGHALHLQTARVKRKSGEYVQRRLVSYGHLRGLKGSSPTSLNYFKFEETVLQFLYELDPTCLESSHSAEQSAAVAEAKVEGIRRRMAELRALLADASRSTVVVADIVDALTRLGHQLAEAEAEQAAFMQRAEAGRARPLDEFRSVLDALAKKPESEHQVLRFKLRALISAVVERIDVRMHRRKNRRVDADLAILLRSGERRLVVHGQHLASVGDAVTNLGGPVLLPSDWWAENDAAARLESVGLGDGGTVRIEPPFAAETATTG